MPKLEFSVRSGLARSVDLQRLQSALQHLAGLFRGNTPRVIPTSIEQPHVAEFIIRLSSKLGVVSAFPGFSRHLQAYLEGVEPAFFVSCLGAFLGGHGLAVEFEPNTRKGKRADLAVDHSEAKVFFEGKSPENPLAGIADEQQRLFNDLHPYLETPHTITVRFRNPLLQDDVRLLGEAIQRRLPSVRADGVFFSQGGIEVSIDTTMDPAPPNMNFVLVLTAPDPEDNTVFPGLLMVRHGKKLAIYGPAISSAGIVTRRLHKAKKQAPLNAPYVVTISSRTLLGAPRDHRLAILEQFHPSKNTRVSGVLIADFPVTAEGAERPVLSFVSNPYAKFSVPGSIRALLGGQ